MAVETKLRMRFTNYAAPQSPHLGAAGTSARRIGSSTLKPDAKPGARGVPPHSLDYIISATTYHDSKKQSQIWPLSQLFQWSIKFQLPRDLSTEHSRWLQMASKCPTSSTPASPFPPMSMLVPMWLLRAYYLQVCRNCCNLARQLRNVTQDAQTGINLRKPEAIVVRLIDEFKIIIVNDLTGSLSGVLGDHLTMSSIGGILLQSDG